ncbi:MAG: hypothetical protein AB7E95_07040 [Kiritimatiellales bacterium]
MTRKSESYGLCPSASLSRRLLCAVMLACALFFAAQVRGEMVVNDALSRRGGEIRGPIKSIKQPGTDQSIVRLYSFSQGVDPDDVITNETLRVLRIWNDRGTPRVDLRKQGQSDLSVRVSSDRVEVPLFVMKPQSAAPAPVTGGMYVSTAGDIYVCRSLSAGWESIWAVAMDKLF